jgi:hypothetical protein
MKASHILLGLMTTLLLQATAHADSVLKPEIVRAFKGPLGEIVTVVYLEKSGEDDPRSALIKFENVQGEWRNRTVLHEISGSGETEDFKMSGTKRVSLTHRTWGWAAYPKGIKGEIRVKFDEKATEGVREKGQEIINSYQKSEKMPH